MICQSLTGQLQRGQDASCASSASLGAPESGTLLPTDTFDVQASFEVPAHWWSVNQEDSVTMRTSPEQQVLPPHMSCKLASGGMLQPMSSWQSHARHPDQQGSSA